MNLLAVLKRTRARYGYTSMNRRYRGASQSSASSSILSKVEKTACSGERVSHLYRNDCFYAHLSIYRFALQFSTGRAVLDFGCGTGYGSAYLADNGAAFVYGVDVSDDAIESCKHYFVKRNLQFDVSGLAQSPELLTRRFGLLFSSNVLEHVADVPSFLRTAWRLLDPDGVMIIAVPPITSRDQIVDNLSNPYHLNIWSPKQWSSMIGQYFSHVRCFTHLSDREGVVLDFGNTPEHTVVDEHDFVFKETSLEEMLSAPTLTAVFVARQARDSSDLPVEGQAPTFVDNSFTRVAHDPGIDVLLAHIAEQDRIIRELRSR